MEEKIAELVEAKTFPLGKEKVIGDVIYYDIDDRYLKKE